MKFKEADAREVGDNLGIKWTDIPLEEFTKGLNVELEHGKRYRETNITKDDRLNTGKIALAHLKEFPDYYTRLQQMEKEAETYWRQKRLTDLKETIVNKVLHPFSSSASTKEKELAE